MSDNLPILWEDKVNNPELLAFLEQYGSAEYLAAAEINQMRDAVNELFYKVRQSKIYENGDLQIFRKPGTWIGRNSYHFQMVFVTLIF